MIASETRIPTLARFALATLMPLPLLATGVFAGGLWVLAGPVWLTLLVAAMDRLVAPDAEQGMEASGDALLVAVAAGHLLALPLAVWAVAGPSGLAGWERAALFLGFGLWFGQVANPAAHELIHRGGRWLFRLGAAVYVTLLFGHHTSAHRLVHHRYAASPADPNTARLGEGFWRFLGRAWIGSFVQGWRAESARRGGGRPHPYAVWIGGAMLSLAAGWVIVGWPGAVVWAGLALHAQVQLLLADYVQHYGLIRAVHPDGRPEPVGPAHSWNAPQAASNWLMLNAARHSDHHASPARPFPALRLPGDVPTLPRSLPVCCLIALVPPMWRRMMRAPLSRWRASAGQGAPAVAG